MVIYVSDSDLAVQAAIHDPDSGEDVPVANFTLAPNQMAERTVVGGNSTTSLPYFVTFTHPSSTTDVGGACFFNVVAGDDFAFVAVNEGLTITRNGAIPATVDETLLASSSLCEEPPAPSPSVAP